MDGRVLDYMQRYRFKKVVICNDTDTGLRAVIAIHSTALGPATGGLRMWDYAHEEDAIFDALRLARGMTYKYAAAGVNLGGGKAVIMGDPKRDKSEALLRAMGRFIDQLNGEYITGEDVGINLDDMEMIHTETDHVVTLPVHAGGAGDISPATALGSVLATRACARRVWGSPELTGKRIALQGLGVCGSKALKLLVDAGAVVTVTDVDPAKVEDAVRTLGVASCDPDAIYDQDVDIFAPYALGAVINDKTIPRLRCAIVAGSANNILAEERHGDELQARGITYAVDYVANSGGTIFDTDRYR
ncbi:MAG TPA: Glu/Leu/Phe/Val dehydrogenase dimerization domain-containing protein, partial [Ilumatobacteraceae bacterium]